MVIIRGSVAVWYTVSVGHGKVGWARRDTECPACTKARSCESRPLVARLHRSAAYEHVDSVVERRARSVGFITKERQGRRGVGVSVSRRVLKLVWATCIR
jgi:hypothetical protein